MSLLKQALDSGEFAVTGEIGPPKGTDISGCLSEADLINNRVTAVNVTDLQSAVMRVGSLAVCAKLIEKGIEPVFQVTCRDRNRLALQSDALSAWCLGIENILCLTGDHPFLGDHAEAKPVFDLDSVQLIKTVSGLNEGHDMGGHDLEGKTDFFVGGVVTPSADPAEPQIIKMKKKIEAGAQFFQTQAVYDHDSFEEFLNKTEGLHVPVIAGIVLLKSAGMAEFMNKNVAGVHVPDALISEMRDTEKDDRKKKSVEIAAGIIEKIKPLCRGVHIMALGWESLIPDIIDSAGLS